MKKLTVKEFAAKLRKDFPGQLDNLNDVTLVIRWLKKYPNDRKYLDKLDAAKVLGDVAVDKVKNVFSKDTTKTQQDTTNDNSVVNTVKDKVNNVIDKVKNTSTTPPKPIQTVDPSVFNCIRNSNTKGKNLQQTKDNPEAYSFFNTDGSEFTFWANGDFTYYDGDTTANGKWKCKGGNNFDATVDWKGVPHYYRSETNEWALTQNAKKTVYENTIKKIVSKNLKSLTK